MPSATSSAMAPVGITPTGTRPSSPRRITEPLPNWRSIWLRTSSNAFSRSCSVMDDIPVLRRHRWGKIVFEEQAFHRCPSDLGGRANSGQPFEVLTKRCRAIYGNDAVDISGVEREHGCRVDSLHHD